jgi:hypothetical protein
MDKLFRASLNNKANNTPNNRTMLQYVIEKTKAGSQRQHYFLLLVIIAAGFVLRFYSLYAGEGYREFAVGDELHAYTVALSLLTGAETSWHIGQPTFSGGHAPGPLWTLFWLSAYKLGGSSVDGAMFIMALLNTFVIYLVYKLATLFVGRNYALLTALLYATGPWPVYYSTGVWNPVPMAFFGAILFLSLWDITQRDNSRSIFIVCLIAAITPQFHMISVFYYPAILLILYLSPAKLNKKWFMAGFIAGICVYLPYFIGEMNNDWENTRAIFGESLPMSFGVAKIISTPIGVLSNQIGRWTDYGFSGYREYGDAYFGSYIILLVINVFSLLISLIIIGSFLRRLFHSLQGNWLSPKSAFANHPHVMFLGILLILPSLLFLLTGHNYGSRYSIIAFPLLFILPAAFLKDLRKDKHIVFFRSAISLMVVINIYLIISFNHHQGELIENGSVFVPSFRKMEAARQEIRKHTDPALLINLDPTDYIKDQPEYMLLGGSFLSNYIYITESFVSHAEQPTGSVTYFIERATDPKTANETIIYQSNGLAVVEREK